MVVPPRSQRCRKHSEHKQRSSGARRPMQRIDPRSVSPGIKPQRQTWLASSRAESGPRRLPHVWKRPGDSRAGRFRPGGVCFRIPELVGLELDDASVHQWRRSDATDAATNSLEDYVSEENPVRVVEVFIDELDLAALGFSGMRPAATGRPALPSLDAAEDLPLRLSQSPAVEPAAGTGSATQYRVDVVSRAARA